MSSFNSGKIGCSEKSSGFQVDSIWDDLSLSWRLVKVFFWPTKIKQKLREFSIHSLLGRPYAYLIKEYGLLVLFKFNMHIISDSVISPL